MSGINVLWVAQYSAKQEPVYHKHEFYQMVCPLSGYVMVNEEYLLGAGQMMLTKPGVLHQFPAVNPEPERNFSMFDCKFTVTDPDIHAALNNVPHCFPIAAPELVRGLIASILTEAKNQKPFFQQNIDCLMSNILVAVIRQFENMPVSGTTRHTEIAPQGHTGDISDVRIGQIAEYVDQNIGKIASLEDLSSFLHRDKSTLTDLFKQSFGITPMRYVTHRRIELTKKLLIEQDLTITQIAEEVGFGSIYHFSKTFKEHVGISPLAFREQRKDAYIHLPHAEKFIGKQAEDYLGL